MIQYLVARTAPAVAAQTYVSGWNQTGGGPDSNSSPYGTTHNGAGWAIGYTENAGVGVTVYAYSSSYSSSVSNRDTGEIESFGTTPSTTWESTASGSGSTSNAWGRTITNNDDGATTTWSSTHRQEDNGTSAGGPTGTSSSSAHGTFAATPVTHIVGTTHFTTGAHVSYSLPATLTIWTTSTNSTNTADTLTYHTTRTTLTSRIAHSAAAGTIAVPKVMTTILPTVEGHYHYNAIALADTVYADDGAFDLWIASQVGSGKISDLAVLVNAAYTSYDEAPPGSAIPMSVTTSHPPTSEGTVGTYTVYGTDYSWEVVTEVSQDEDEFGMTTYTYETTAVVYTSQVTTIPTARQYILGTQTIAPQTLVTYLPVTYPIEATYLTYHVPIYFPLDTTTATTSERTYTEVRVTIADEDHRRVVDGGLGVTPQGSTTTQVTITEIVNTFTDTVIENPDMIVLANSAGYTENYVGGRTIAVPTRFDGGRNNPGVEIIGPHAAQGFVAFGVAGAPSTVYRNVVVGLPGGYEDLRIDLNGITTHVVQGAVWGMVTKKGTFPVTASMPSFAFINGTGEWIATSLVGAGTTAYTTNTPATGISSKMALTLLTSTATSFTGTITHSSTTTTYPLTISISLGDPQPASELTGSDYYNGQGGYPAVTSASMRVIYRNGMWRIFSHRDGANGEATKAVAGYSTESLRETVKVFDTMYLASVYTTGGANAAMELLQVARYYAPISPP